jgi:hypothetical protein
VLEAQPPAQPHSGERKVLQDMEAALTKLAEAVETETSNSNTIAHPLNLSPEEPPL